MQRVLCNSPTLPLHSLLQRRQPRTCNITVQDRLFLIVWLLSCVVNIQYRGILKRVAGCNQRTQSGSLNSKHVARLIFSLSPLKSLPMETQRQMIAVKCFLQRGRGGGKLYCLDIFHDTKWIVISARSLPLFSRRNLVALQATKVLPTVWCNFVRLLACRPVVEGLAVWVPPPTVHMWRCHWGQNSNLTAPCTGSTLQFAGKPFIKLLFQYRLKYGWSFSDVLISTLFTKACIMV